MLIREVVQVMGAVLSVVAHKAADQVKLVGRVVKVARAELDKTGIREKKCITGSLHL